MSHVTLRPARDSDVDELVALLGALFAIEADFQPDPARQRQGLLLMLGDPARRSVLVAERGGKVVGMATAQLVVSTAEGSLSAWIEDVVVAKLQRREGIGRLLVDATVAWAVSRGATRCQLLADRENAPALAFYARLGWRSTQLVCLRGT